MNMCTNHTARNVPACLVALWVFAVMLAPRDVEGSVVSRSRDTKKCDFGSPPPQGFKRCRTEACERYAKLVLANMDTCQRPCEDFYQFACGNTGNEHAKLGKTGGNQRVEHTLKIREKLMRRISEPVKKGDNKPTTLAKKMFQSCVDASEMKKRGLEPFKKLLSDLGGWPLVIGQSWDERQFDWRHLTYKLRDNGQNYNVFFFLTKEEKKNTNSYTLAIKPTGPLPLGAVESKNLHRAILDFAISIGADKKMVLLDLRKVSDLEEKLRKIVPPDSNIKDKSPYMTVAEMKKQFPTVDWKEFLNNIVKTDRKLDEHSSVYVQSQSYIKSLLQLLSKTPPRTVANYMIKYVFYYDWSVVKDIIGNFDPFLNEDEMLSNNQKIICYNKIFGVPPFVKFLTPALGSMYVKEFFDNKLIPSIHNMTTHIKNAFKDILNATSWMDRKTTKVTIEKLDAMKVIVGYPDELMNETKLDQLFAGLDFKEGKYLENVRQLNKATADKTFRQLWSLTNEYDWTAISRSFDVNAYYNTDINRFIVNAGYIQDGVFDMKRPDYMNYGGIGFTIGHEIGHGFDVTGSQYDKTGIKRDLWSKNMNAIFKNKTKCFIEQYNNYSIVVEGKVYNVNGTLTLGENLADHSGALSAYSAYVKMAVQRGETEPGLPGLETLSPRQMFWVSLAQSYCGVLSSVQLENNIILKDEHTIDPLRVLGALSNLEQFSRDFNCPLNTKMNPEKKCNTWQ